MHGKKVVWLVVIVVGICVLGSSCGTLFTQGGSEYRSGRSSYEKQEYVAALGYLSQALAVNPEFVEAEQLFLQAFTEGTAYYKLQGAESELIGDPQSADRVYIAYTRLHEMHEIARASGQRGLVTEDFSESVQKARVVSGDMWFAHAQDLREKGDRTSLREAVSALETARNRNPAIEGIDAMIAQVTDEATVIMAVVAYGSLSDDQVRYVVDEVTKTFSNNRFVEVVQRHDFSPDPGVLVGAVDLAVTEAMGKGWDYVLAIYVHDDFQEISNETPVRLPSGTPLFLGVKREIGYQRTTTISYQLLHIDGGVNYLVEDRVSEVDGPHLYTFSFVRAEGLRELNLGGTGKRNLRYISTTAHDATVDTAISKLRWDYETIQIPAEVQVSTDQTQWYAYFNNRYKDFISFAANESDRELFYATEVVHHRPSDTYFIIGLSVEEAVRRSNINSAIMNGLSHTARNLIAEAKKAGNTGYLKAGSLAANAIRHLL